MEMSLNQFFMENFFATVEFFQLRDVHLPSEFEDAIQLTEVKKQDIQKAYAEMNQTRVQLENEDRLLI